MSDHPSTPPRIENLIEAAAKAIHLSDERYREIPWDHWHESTRENYRVQARAALESIDLLAVLTSMGAEVVESQSAAFKDGASVIHSKVYGGVGEYVVIRKDALEGSE